MVLIKSRNKSYSLQRESHQCSEDVVKYKNNIHNSVFHLFPQLSSANNFTKKANISELLKILSVSCVMKTSRQISWRPNMVRQMNARPIYQLSVEWSIEI